MDRDKVRAFADKVYADTAGAMATGMVYVGTVRDGGSGAQTCRRAYGQA